MHDVLTAVGIMIDGQSLSADAKHTVHWCLERLPGLYDKFFATYESRYREEILRIEGAISKHVGNEAKDLAQNIHQQFQEMHVSLGFQGSGHEAA